MSIYFLFLESLGTPELILIALVALIVFGPRKLPTIGRTIGKYTAEFKRASRDFRETWEREVQEAEAGEKGSSASENSLAKLEADFTPYTNGVENTIGRGAPWAQNTEPETFTAEPVNEPIALPEVRAVENSNFHEMQNGNSVEEITETVEVAETVPQRKRDWL
ncbi:MAG: twin-arginine translocase TatA/TatE family subunit [Acidobacteriota bacterium]|nr:twin-arginine translocase TatA/TatE family subunit [Acidobacteriota bacterium]